MTPYYERHGITVHHGDCLDRLAELDSTSVDAVVTDPPYSLEFMGHGWDRHATPAAFQQWCQAWATECLRVLRPGGHLAAFGGTRTYHRLTCGIEDAGFEVRDSIGVPLAAWVHGQGFPKGKNQLKPAWEPIVLARKPPVGTLAATIAAHGTGALNIDATRTAGVSAGPGTTPPSSVEGHRSSMAGALERVGYDGSKGRWPSNVLLSHADECADECEPGCPVGELDAQSGTLKSGDLKPYVSMSGKRGGIMGETAERDHDYTRAGDSGSASRYFPVFRWEAKATTAERPQVGGESHPTVKPLDLMRWLVRLVTPPGGLVLDPFAGSGTTLHAARAEGFRAIGIERHAPYLPLIKARLDARPRQAGPAAPADDEPMDLLDLLGDAS